MLNYNKIEIKNNNLIALSLKIDKGCYSVLSKIYDKNLNEKPLIFIIFDEKDFKNFGILIYNLLKLYFNNNIVIIFENHKTNNVSILDDCFNYFIGKGNNFILEEIEEYLDDKINSINKTEKITLDDIKNLFRVRSYIQKDKDIEDLIKDDPYLSCEYAIKTNDRFSEGEKAIATSHVYSFQYARDIIKGRFPEGEPGILKEPDFFHAYNYMLEKNGIEPISN